VTDGWFLILVKKEVHNSSYKIITAFPKTSMELMWMWHETVAPKCLWLSSVTRTDPLYASDHTLMRVFGNCSMCPRNKRALHGLAGKLKLQLNTCDLYSEYIKLSREVRVCPTDNPLCQPSLLFNETGVNSREWSGRGLMLTTNLLPVPRLSIHGAIILLFHTLSGCIHWQI
jgi:hypothetical protein